MSHHVVHTNSGPDPLPKDADPDLANIKDNPKPVMLGNKCTVKKKYLDKVPVEVHWTQLGMSADDTYYEVAFTNVSIDNIKGFLFIAQDNLDEFRQQAKEEGDLYTFEVTSAFQYGQLDKKGRNRFMVYHDPELIHVSQHRFILGTWLKYGNMAFDHVGKLPQGAKAIGIAVDTITRRLGDQLKRF